MARGRAARRQRPEGDHLRWHTRSGLTRQLEPFAAPVPPWTANWNHLQKISAGLESTDVPSRTSCATDVCNPQARARRITGTNPAHDTRFGPLKLACCRDALCNDHIYKVPSRSRCWKLSATPIIPAQRAPSLSRHDQRARFFGGSRLKRVEPHRRQNWGLPFSRRRPPGAPWRMCFCPPPCFGGGA